MGTHCSKATEVVTDAIPDREVLLEIVERIVQFEELIRQGHEISRPLHEEGKQLAGVKRELVKLQTRDFLNKK